MMPQEVVDHRLIGTDVDYLLGSRWVHLVERRALCVAQIAASTESTLDYSIADLAANKTPKCTALDQPRYEEDEDIQGLWQCKSHGSTTSSALAIAARIAQPYAEYRR